MQGVESRWHEASVHVGFGNQSTWGKRVRQPRTCVIHTLFNMWTVKEILSALSLIVASIIAIWAMLLPPQGEVDQSILITIAQFLVFAATLLGVDSSIERIKKLLKKWLSAYHNKSRFLMKVCIKHSFFRLMGSEREGRSDTALSCFV